MPDILKLAPQDMARLHRQVRMLALDRLHPRQFIQADRAFPVPGSFGGLRIDLTSLNDFLFPPLVGNFRQPIPEAVRLQPPFLSR